MRMIDGLQYICHSLMFLHISIRLYRSLKERACQLFAQDDTRREHGPLVNRLEGCDVKLQPATTIPAGVNSP